MEYAFSFEKITEYTIEEITEYWKNRTDGEYCTELFGKIVDNYQDVQGLVNEINGWVETYNKDCSDKCLPGHVKCKGDGSDNCILEKDCCDYH